MGPGQAGNAYPALVDVILRDADASDDAALASFDPGSGEPWLDEVAEIVDGLIAWRDDPAELDLDRRVVVADDDGQIVAVVAHERLEHERVGVLTAHRYLMVVAVREDCQQLGFARMVTEAAVAEVQTDGANSVSWLVYPSNEASIGFSRHVFPEAEESSPPEDDPYLRFVLGL